MSKLSTAVSQAAAGETDDRQDKKDLLVIPVSASAEHTHQHPRPKHFHVCATKLVRKELDVLKYCAVR